LLVAHPGHELSLYGWIAQTRPAIHVLTDGSGHGVAPRLDATAEFLVAVGATPGCIFGAFSDREVYAILLRRDGDALASLVMTLAAGLRRDRPRMLVTDAAEGYNPVHDLCRLVAGAAIEIAEVETKLYQYAVVNRPDSIVRNDDNAIVIDLDDSLYAAKLDRARSQIDVIPDIDVLLERHGADAYRREVLYPVVDWTHVDLTSTPGYEKYGEERRSAHLYEQVIRRDEHFLPLRDALRDIAGKRTCVS
jgi:hypothetical protein